MLFFGCDALETSTGGVEGWVKLATIKKLADWLELLSLDGFPPVSSDLVAPVFLLELVIHEVPVSVDTGYRNGKWCFFLANEDSDRFPIVSVKR